MMMNARKKLIIYFGILIYFCIFATDNYKTPIVKMKTMDIFKRYDSPEQYAKAFQQMIDARERWREQIREHSAATAK